MPRDTCFFDGVCGLCRRTRRVLSALDWLRALDWVDFTTLPPEQMPVPLDQALAGMPMRTSNGRILLGFPAVRRALRRTPVGLVPALLLHMPGVSWLGRITYNRIAASRARACHVEGSATARTQGPAKVRPA
jgi:predicted DCC family thiol-disulfide oxidoreductase YuxK